MSEIKHDLKDIVENLLIPEVEAYLEELHKLLEEKKETADDIIIIKEMESFLVELHNIVAVVEEGDLSDEEYLTVYNKIMKSVKESEEAKE